MENPKGSAQHQPGPLTDVLDCIESFLAGNSDRKDLAYVLHNYRPLAAQADAAPDLLAALMAARFALIASGHDMTECAATGTLQPLGSTIDAAIAKAEGRS